MQVINRNDRTPRKAWHRRWSVRVFVGLVLLVAVIGVIAETAPDPVAPPAAVVEEQRPTEWENAQAARAEYMAGLFEINPELTANPNAAVRAGENVCLDVDGGKDAATVTGNTAQRYGVDTATAERIVALAARTVCAA